MPDGDREPVDLPSDAVVIRFRPTDPERVLTHVDTAYRETGHYRLSVFADAARDGEDRQAVINRLLEVAQLSGMDPTGHKKLYICATSAELLDLNFSFHKDEDDDEHDEHYSVDLGPAPGLPDVERFLDAFSEEQRWTT